MNDTNESRLRTATLRYVLSDPNERIERTERMRRHPPLMRTTTLLWKESSGKPLTPLPAAGYYPLAGVTAPSVQRAGPRWPARQPSTR